MKGQKTRIYESPEEPLNNMLRRPTELKVDFAILAESPSFSFSTYIFAQISLV